MRVAAINDLSGLGRCSLAVDLSVFPAMGIETCAVPTAVLSGQTGFESYYCKDLTGAISEYTAKYKEQNIYFDGIITGFMLSETQAENSLEFIKTFKTEDTLILVDPVLGDDGKRYVNFSDGLLGVMKKMVKEADIITPNMTELCLLADIDPEKPREFEGKELIDFVIEAGKRVRGNSKQIIAVTGIPLKEEHEVGNLVITDLESVLIKAHTNGVHYSGTGDLFAAVLLGGLLNGKDIASVTKLAGDFIRASVEETEKIGSSGNDGIAFERNLGMLIS